MTITLKHVADICGFISHGNEGGAIRYAKRELGLSDSDARQMVKFGIAPNVAERSEGAEVTP